MVFSSALFLFVFLPVAYVIAAATHKFLFLQNILLAAVSVFFYAWGNPDYAVLLVLSVLVNYFIALGIDSRNVSKPASQSCRKLLLTVSVVLNVGMLCVMKYSNFAVLSMNGVLGVSIPQPDIPLPIGISFFTFQAMSYVIDVYRRDTPSQKDFIGLLLYISFFPQLIAGPIVRYGDIAPTLGDRQITVYGTAYGLRRFIFGLAKKLLIADVMGEIADTVFAMDIGQTAAPSAWVGAVAYMFQIYFDFSGYSDMAIGLGKMLGFNFKENFDYPYIAASMRDFWRRWHISLSTWFREYVYIPLGGNRRGKAREGVNKLIVFFLTGLWHGANWTFVVWGLFHGFFLMLESYGVIRVCKLPKPVLRVYTLLIVTVGFVMFRADTVNLGFSMIAAMFGCGALLGAPSAGMSVAAQLNQALSLLPPADVLIMAVAAVASVPFHKKLIARIPVLHTAAFVLSVPLLMLCVMRLATSGYNPFIYFRF